MTSGSPWVLCFEPRPSALIRLLCLHHAGAGASTFRTWSRQLPRWIEVVAIQLPGREARLREPIRGDLCALAGELAEGLGALVQRPFALFGHSMGALLGFELARQLRANAGIEPQHLFVGGYGAPHVYRGGTRLDLMAHDEVLSYLRATHAMAEAVLDNRELARFFVPIIQADIALCANHVRAGVADEPLRAPISAFGGTDDPEVPVSALRRWSDLTTAAFCLRMLPGNHLFPASARTPLLKAITHDLRARVAASAPAAVRASGA